MQLNLPSQEEPEIIISPEDLPSFRLTKESDSNDEAQYKDKTPLEIATKFLLELETGLRLHKTEDLLTLYDRKFNRISEQVFKNEPWPTPEEIEKTNENYEFDITTQVFYDELCYRHLNKNTAFGPEVRANSYLNYIEIFNSVIDGREELSLPISWVWDILDEFVYQYQAFCQFRSKLTEDGPEYKYFLNESDGIWTLEKVTEVLNNLVASSGVVKNGTLEEPSVQYKSNQYFGYFAIIALLRLNVLICDYEAAIKAIEPIGFNKLHIYAKAFPCLNSFFYHAGFAYLMTKKYKESVKLFELILSCFIKYKQFYSKSYQFETMTRQAEKSLLLLSIALVFFPTHIDETVLINLKEKLYERYDKLQKYDQNAFGEAFSQGSPKLILPVKNVEHFKTMKTENNSSIEIIAAQKNSLKTQFIRVQQLNNLTGVLKLYDSIKLDKLAKVLKVTQDELKGLIALHQERSSTALKDVPFEQTIIKRILESVQSLDFAVQGDVVIVKNVAAKANFSKIFTRNMNKVEEITHEIENL